MQTITPRHAPRRHRAPSHAATPVRIGARTTAFAATLTAVLAGMVSSAHADTTADRTEQRRYVVETVNLGNGQFMQRKTDFARAGCMPDDDCRKPSPYNRFDWGTDSCSPPTFASWRKLFDQACQQHDFGYRNLGNGLALARDENTRKWVDDRFRAEMKAICNYRFSDWTQYANLQACFKEADTMYGAVRLINNWQEPATTQRPADPAAQQPAARAETTGGPTSTWTDFGNAGGDAGPLIPGNSTVQVACKVTGFRVANGNTWWYRIASPPWNGMYYASGDAFYNNGQTSGSLRGTPLVDDRVPAC